MRRRLVVGLGVAGIVAGAFAPIVAGQDPTPTTPPASRPAAPPTLPSGYDPPTPPAAVPERPVPVAAPPVGRLPMGVTPLLQPAPGTRPAAPLPSVEIPTAIPPDHDWLLKPEHGEFFISVKSYSRPSRATDDDLGPSAFELAEALAGEIRDLYRVNAFLFEYVSEERKAEAAAIATARERGRLFAQQLDKYRAQAQLQGMEFLEDRSLTIHYKTVNYKDQIAVLVGPFKTDEDARKALDVVKKWPAPKTKVRSSRDPNRRETSLMDWGSVVRPGPDGKPVLEQSYMNPYTTATVVPNPAVPRARGTEEFDPFILKLNEGRPYSLLNATKGWTLAVKSFSAPVEIVGRDGGKDVMRKPGMSRGADVLAAGAEQAEALAKAIRAMKGPQGEPLGLEAFVLHTRGSSLVTVGQFDGPNDPALIQKKRLLDSMKVNVTEDKTGLKPVANAPSVFGSNIMPIPIPKIPK